MQVTSKIKAMQSKTTKFNKSMTLSKEALRISNKINSLITPKLIYLRNQTNLNLCSKKISKWHKITHQILSIRICLSINPVCNHFNKQFSVQVKHRKTKFNQSPLPRVTISLTICKAMILTQKKPIMSHRPVKSKCSTR